MRLEQKLRTYTKHNGQMLWAKDKSDHWSNTVKSYTQGVGISTQHWTSASHIPSAGVQTPSWLSEEPPANACMGDSSWGLKHFHFWKPHLGILGSSLGPDPVPNAVSCCVCLCTHSRWLLLSILSSLSGSVFQINLKQ